jgi:hypothetical protein
MLFYPRLKSCPFVPMLGKAVGTATGCLQKLANKFLHSSAHAFLQSSNGTNFLTISADIPTCIVLYLSRGGRHSVVGITATGWTTEGSEFECR